MSLEPSRRSGDRGERGQVMACSGARIGNRAVVAVPEPRLHGRPLPAKCRLPTPAAYVPARRLGSKCNRNACRTRVSLRQKFDKSGKKTQESIDLGAFLHKLDTLSIRDSIDQFQSLESCAPTTLSVLRVSGTASRAAFRWRRDAGSPKSPKSRGSRVWLASDPVDPGRRCRRIETAEPAGRLNAVAMAGDSASQHRPSCGRTRGCRASIELSDPRPACHSIVSGSLTLAEYSPSDCSRAGVTRPTAHGIAGTPAELTRIRIRPKTISA